VRLLGLAIFAAGWAAAAVAVGKPHLLPGPATVIETAWTMRAELVAHAGRSLARVGAGYLAAVAVALPVGWGCGAVPALDRELARLLDLLRPVPPFVWIPLLLLWVGIGDVSAACVVFAGAVFPILRLAREGVATVPKAWMLAGRNLGASPWQMVWRVQVPAALPLTFTGLRLGWTLAWMSVVAAELVGADGGLGQLILDARNLARPDIAMAGMATIGGIAAGTEALLRRLG
jgi:ABC-type nitrate/sulfonate/bicarbonate transport system permease component